MSGGGEGLERGVDQRLDLLCGWLEKDLGIKGFDIAPASSDASFRRYFRINVSGGTFIVMDAPPDKEDCRPFVNVAAAMHGFGVNVPQVLQQDLSQGFLLLTDLGTQQYLGVLSAETAPRLYGDAISSLIRLQSRGPVESASLPPYDYALLMREMQLFPDWFLGRHLGLELGQIERDALAENFDWLAHQALAQPRVWVHRDYHSRNLMVTSDRNPGVLDFQDAVIGAVTYDLVSLLRDCYVSWPLAQVRAWVQDYHRQAVASGILQGVEFEELLSWFDLMGVQRHLKAIGIFARLNHRDGKPGYLKDIPRTLRYVTDVVAHEPQLKELRRIVEESVWPRL